MVTYSSLKITIFLFLHPRIYNKSMKNIFQRILLAKPTMYSNSLILNILGMQLYRILFFYLYRVLRTPKPIPEKYKSYFNELMENGVVVVPNFFNEETYTKIKAEYDKLTPEFDDDPSEVALPHVKRILTDDSRVSSLFRDSFDKNEMLEAIQKSYTNRNYYLPKQIALTKIFVNEDEINLPKNGYIHNLHIDAPMRVFKAFYYVRDTDKENGAFSYCLKSNKRNSLKRLWLEYKLSIRFAKNKGNSEHQGEYLNDAPWVKVTDEEAKENNLIPTVMAAKGNSMIFADVGGFHKRGSFSSSISRDTVETNFREVETMRNNFYPIENFLKKYILKK